MLLKLCNVKDFEQTMLGTLCHDVNGNIIVQIGSKYYFLSIDRNDDLEFMELNYEETVEREQDVNYREIRSTQEKFSLKSKIVEEIEKEKEREEDEGDKDFEDEEVDDDMDIRMYFKCYPEERNYYVDRTGDGGEYEEDEAIFKFSKSGNYCDIKCLDRTMGSNAVYDTFVLGKGKEVLFTLELNQNQKSSYRVTFDFDGFVELNIVGTRVKRFTLGYDIVDDVLELKMVRMG